MLLRVNVDAPDDKLTEFGAGAKLYWARDNSSAAGAFADASGSVALLATQSQYEIVDATGQAGHFYRTRVGNAGATAFDAWSDVFQAGAISAYATLDDLREELAIPDKSADNRLSDLLEQASRYLDERCGHDFLRHPQVSGSESRLFWTEGGSNLLLVRAGIVSLSQVELTTYTGGTYSSLAASDWALWPSEVRPYHSHEGVLLSGLGTYQAFYAALDGARLTGVFGYEQVPPIVAKATLDLAREWFRQGPGGGGPVGVNQFGTPIFGGGEPKSVRDAIEAYALDKWLVY